MSGKMMRMDKRVVEIVETRAGGYCEVCGLPALASMALHHRKLKSRGGKDTAANLIWIHHGCHNLRSDSIHMRPENASQKGWMVGSWQEPQDVPFTKPDGSIVLLHDNGDVSVLMEGD
jgi:hypothetical protein